MEFKNKFIITFLLLSSFSFGQGSYISRLWNTKSYDKIIEYSPKGTTLSGRDNMTVGRAFMAIVPQQPSKALMHYNLAISKRMNSEDLYYFRAEAYYELKQLREALGDLEKCLELRTNHQKYMLFKAAIQYEMGDLKSAYETYYAISELYDKQTPFYMLARISIERENYYKAKEWIDSNMDRFERGKDFWRMTAEQFVETEWHVWKEYDRAQKAQDDLLSFFPNDVRYLKNRLGLYRVQGLDSLGVWAENDLLARYNENRLPLEYYKKGSIKVGEYVRDHGEVEDYLTFRPALFENTKYARFYISESGAVVGKHWAALQEHPQDSTKKIWDFHRGDAHYAMPASDTSYLGFTALFDAPDSVLIGYDDFFILNADSTVLDSTNVAAPEVLEETPMEPEIMPFEGIPTEDPMEVPQQVEAQDSTGVREE
ncbi:MAG: tetratricopeptide repeat protein [Schleiferiaceae bacterium]